MKKIFLSLVLVAAMVFPLLCGCRTVSGTDGRDGQDLSIYEIYEACNAARSEQGLEQIDFLEFLQEYLHYDFTYSEQDSAQSIMNRSLLSGVAILCGFNYSSSRPDYYVGSGVIVDIDRAAGDAYILTNCHVICDTAAKKYASQVYVYLYGNDDIYDDLEGVSQSSGRISASIEGSCVMYDLALLKVSGSEAIKNGEAVAATFSDEEEAYVGAEVYAIGNPEGAGLSLTRGVISKESEIITLNLSDNANDSRFNRDYRVIRTDTAVNGGNSGGGLFGMDGKLVGIINSKAVSDEIDNIGYALAGSYAKRVWKLMRDGYTSRSGQFGIRMAVLPVDIEYVSSSYFDNEKNLAVITDKVYAVSSKDKLQSGDVFKHIKIVDVSGNTLEDMDVTRYFNLGDALLSARDDCTVIYTVIREGEEVTVETSPFFRSED